MHSEHHSQQCPVRPVGAEGGQSAAGPRGKRAAGDCALSSAPSTLSAPAPLHAVTVCASEKPSEISSVALGLGTPRWSLAGVGAGVPPAPSKVHEPQGRLAAKGLCSEIVAPLFPPTAGT